MLYQDESIKNTNKAMASIAKHKEERERVQKIDIDLCRKLTRLNRESKSVQRTRDRNKIRKFNELFFDTVRQLTNIRRMQGRNNVREVEAIINEWKAKHYVF